MKLLFIADSTSIHTQRWVNYFIEKGHQVYLITIGLKREIIPGATHLANFDRFYYASPSFFPVLMKTRRILRAVRPDIVHGHFIHQYGWLAALSGFHPLVLTAWGTDILNLPEASRTGIGRWLTRYALKKADRMTATSEYLKTEMAKLGADPGRVRVFFWGVDPGKFRPDVDTAAICRRLNIKEDRPVILSNRNFLPLYNNDVVIDAMALVLRKHPGAILILQNAGGSLEEALKRRARDKGIVSSVIFLPQYPHEELPPLYALADVYVSVPSWDAGPVSLKEAMASHAAPVISAIPGPMEWVQDNINGRVVPVRDPERLAEAVCQLLADPGRRERFNRMNREMIETRADHRFIMDLVEKDIYQPLLKATDGAGKAER